MLMLYWYVLLSTLSRTLIRVKRDVGLYGKSPCLQPILQASSPLISPTGLVKVESGTTLEAPSRPPVPYMPTSRFRFEVNTILFLGQTATKVLHGTQALRPTLKTFYGNACSTNRLVSIPKLEPVCSLAWIVSRRRCMKEVTILKWLVLEKPYRFKQFVPMNI